jgi:hypothetical protein
MATATSLRCVLPPAEQHSGPFDVWNPAAPEDERHHYLVTLAAARVLAEVDSEDGSTGCRVQVLDADHHLVGWARRGVWHGAVA